MGRSVLEYWGAAISHRSAAELWKLLSFANGPIDVSVPGDGGRRKRVESACIGLSPSYLGM